MTQGLIDVHAHYVSDAYREAAEVDHAQPDGIHAIPEWSAAEHVAMMDRAGIAVSMLSVSSPGVHFGDDDAARSSARQVNEDGARAKRDHAGRFGLLASLPLPDVDGTIAELTYCAEELGVDGFCVLTHGNGVYLCDRELDPVFEELDRRHARVLIHPTSPVCWEQTSLSRPRPMIEFMFDTTRAVVNLILNGTIARYPNIEIIVPHAGATLPLIADRVAAFRHILPDIEAGVDVMADLASLHYDLAGFAVPRGVEALLSIVESERLHYGSDYPFTPEGAVSRLAQQLGDFGDPPGALLATLEANTRALFTKLG